MKFTASEIPHARRARMLGAKNGYITLRDLKLSDDPLWVEDDFGLPLPQRDSPLLFRFSLHPDDLRRLELPRLRPSQWNVAPYLLAEAGLATLDRRRLSYSRRAAWYSRRPWYYGPFCTRRGVINTVDALEALGLIGQCVLGAARHSSTRTGVSGASECSALWRSKKGPALAKPFAGREVAPRFQAWIASRKPTQIRCTAR